MGSGQYKTLSAACEVHVRRMSPERSDPRLISRFRKPSHAAAGFIVELSQGHQVNTLVELDVKFPGQPFTYRGRGVVDWVDETGNPERPHKLGITVFGMKKLGESDSVIPEPPKRVTANRTPAVTAAQTAETPLLTPMPKPAVPSPSDDDNAPEAPADADGMHAMGSRSVAAEAASLGTSVPEQEVLPLPKQKEIIELLTNLIGEAVGVKRKKEAPLTSEDFAAVGSFITDDDQILALLAMDLGLCNWLAAAIAMVPSSVAKEEIAMARLSEATMENLQEILNISASVFNKPKVPHLKFSTLYLNDKENLPDPVRKIMTTPSAQADFKVDVPNYGTGLLSCLFGSYSGPV